MKKIIVAVMVLLPQVLFAQTDCWVQEYPDHYLAVCNGDGKAERPVPNQSPATRQPTTATQQVTPLQTAVQSSPAAAENAPRPGRRMSKSRLEAAIIARNKLLQNKE